MAFDLRSSENKDPGYDSDDSDSTVQSAGHNSARHRRSQSSSAPYSSRSRDYRLSQNNSKHSQSPHKAPDSESDSTIDLPARFDSRGHLLTQKEDPALEKFEDFMNRFARVLF